MNRLRSLLVEHVPYTHSCLPAEVCSLECQRPSVRGRVFGWSLPVCSSASCQPSSHGTGQQCSPWGCRFGARAAPVLNLGD